MIKIEIREDEDSESLGTVRVEYQGKTHTANWNADLEETGLGNDIFDIVGDEGILVAALYAWTGQEGTWEITPEELEQTSQGHWPH